MLSSPGRTDVRTGGRNSPPLHSDLFELREEIPPKKTLYAITAAQGARQ